MAEIKQAKFIDQTGQEKDAVFIGAEKAIYDDSGKRLDQKLEEREKATGLLASDMQGILGNAGAEVSLQAIIDKVAEKITNELVSNSSLTQTLANYITKAMMSNVQVNDGNKVPTSALAYAMQQAITANANGITQLNNNLHMTSESKRITVNGNQHNIKIDKIGNLLCVCNITLNTVTFNGSAFDVYTDPFDVSYRPKSTCVSPLSINGGEAMMEVMMLPDGRINLWNPNYKGNATMPMRGTLIWTV